MSLREEFESILAEFGHNILLVRAATKVRCSCWNEKTQEADRTCPICFGVGVVPIIEKHTVRDTDTSVPETLARIISDQSFGGIAVPGRVYYFKHDVKIQSEDLIIEVDWSATGKPIYNGGYVMGVNHVDPERWEGGQVVFKKAYLKDEPVLKEIRGINVVNANGIKNYELIQGEVK